MKTLKKTFYDLKLVKKFLVEKRHEIREIEKIPPTESDSYLGQFVLATRTKAGKDNEPSSLRRILAGVERHLSHSDPETVISNKKKKRDALKAKQKQLNSMYANNDAISIDRDPVHVYKMYKEKRPPSMLEPDSSFYLSLNYFKTETDASVEGRNWFKAQPMGVNKLNNIMKDITQAAGIAGKTNHVKQW